MVLPYHQVDNAGVGLVENEKIHILRRHPRFFQSSVYAPGNDFHGEFEHLCPLHGDQVSLSGLQTGKTQQFIIALSTQHGADGGPALPTLHYGGTGAIPEEDAGAPIFPIADTA